MPKSGNFSPAFLGSLTPATTIPQYEISNLLRCSPALNFKDKSLKLELKNPVEQGGMETVSYGRFL